MLIIDSGLKDVDTVSFVATDNFAAGRMAGEKMADVFEVKDARVALLRYLEGSASTTERENGFLEGVKKNPRVQVVSSDQFAGATTETAQKASENIIARFKNPSGGVQFDGVFCPNESSTFGMLRALQDAGLAGKVRFFGFDSSPKLLESLQAGEIDGLVVQDPFKIGYLGVLIMGTLDNAMSLLNIQAFWKLVISGSVLLLAMMLDCLKHRQIFRAKRARQ